MTVEHSKLRALAEAATPGPWHVDDNHPADYLGVSYANEDRRGHVATVVEFRREQGRRDVRYLAAASPDVVLALVDLVEQNADIAKYAAAQATEANQQLSAANAEVERMRAVLNEIRACTGTMVRDSRVDLLEIRNIIDTTLASEPK
jgi:hypothetical protein